MLSCTLKRAVYNTPDNQCLECYIPFIHSRHNANDRSLGVGCDINGDFMAGFRSENVNWLLVRLSDRRTEDGTDISKHHRPCAT